MGQKELLSEIKRLFEIARKFDEFEFVNVLIGYNGMGDQRALTHLYESRSYIADMKTQLAATTNKHTRARLGLHIYCHLFEMDELYNILGNLLRIAVGQNLRYKPDLYNRHSDPLLTPTDKFQKLKDLAQQSRFEELIDNLDELYNNKIRNAFLHSAYSLVDDDFCIVKGDGISIGNGRYNSVSIDNFLMPIINNSIEFIDTLFALIDDNKMSYVANKIVMARMPDTQPVVILGDAKNGLVGFQTFVGSWIKIKPAYDSQYFVEAMNLRMESGKGAMAELGAKLEEYVDSKTPFGKEFNFVRDEVLALNEPDLKRDLATVYYNWANNTAATADGKPARQQEAILKSAIERYHLAIQTDPKFARSYHNLGTTLLKQAKITNSLNLKVREEALELFNKTLSIDKNMFEAWLNSGRMLSEIANIEADSAKQVDFFHESISRYLSAFEIYPHDPSAFENVGWIYWRLANLKQDSKGNFKKAIENYKAASKLKPDARTTIALTSIMTEYAEVDNENNKKIIEEAIELLMKAQQEHGDSSDLSFSLGNKYVVLGNILKNQNTLKMAAESFKQAVQFDSANMRARNNWGHCEILLSTYEEENIAALALIASAEGRLKYVIEHDPAHEMAWYNLGLIEGEKAKKTANGLKGTFLDSAINYLLKANEMNPSLSSYDLARMFSLKGELDQAVKWLDSWLQTEEGDLNTLENEADFSNLQSNKGFEELLKAKT